MKYYIYAWQFCFYLRKYKYRGILIKDLLPPCYSLFICFKLIFLSNTISYMTTLFVIFCQIKTVNMFQGKELERVKTLVLDGKIPINKAPTEMSSHPIMFLESYIAVKERKRRKVTWRLIQFKIDPIKLIIFRSELQKVQAQQDQTNPWHQLQHWRLKIKKN